MEFMAACGQLSLSQSLLALRPTAAVVDKAVCRKMSMRFCDRAQWLACRGAVSPWPTCDVLTIPAATRCVLSHRRYHRRTYLLSKSLLIELAHAS